MQKFNDLRVLARGEFSSQSPADFIVVRQNDSPRAGRLRHRRHGPVMRLAPLTGPVGRRMRSRRQDLVAAAAAHGVSNLRVFGSVARGTDRPDSDLDLLADLPPGMGLLGLGRVQDELEAIVGGRVDLIPAEDLKPGVRARVMRDLVAL
jgi:predicted nucleotidyltransferase